MQLWKPIPRKEGVEDRTVWVGLFGRFTDELLGGLFTVLLPTFRTVFGLSLAQAALLSQALEYVAVVVEPIAGLLNDVWQRKWIMTFGAFFCGLSLITIGVAPTFVVLLVGFALYGIGTGPMAHSADILLVETHPDAPDRIFNRSTIIDTIGAFIAPLLVTATFWLGLDWRWLLVSAGLGGFWYAWIIGRSRFPEVREGDSSKEEDQRSLLKTLRINLATVLSDQTARRWLFFLLILSIFEAPFTLRSIWLNEQVGMSQSLIGIYVAIELGVNLIALLLLDRWREKHSAKRILLVALIVLIVLMPLWILLPGILTRFVLAVPINIAFALLWPIGKGQSLASVPGKAGAITAISSLFSIIPLPLLFGLLAQAITLTTAMLIIHLVALVGLLFLSISLPSK